MWQFLTQPVHFCPHLTNPPSPSADVNIYIHHIICQIATRQYMSHLSSDREQMSRDQSGLFSTARAVTVVVIRIAMHCCIPAREALVPSRVADVRMQSDPHPALSAFIELTPSPFDADVLYGRPLIGILTVLPSVVTVFLYASVTLNITKAYCRQ